MRRRRERSSSGTLVLVALVAALAGFFVRGLVASPERAADGPVVTLLACPEPQTAPAAPTTSITRRPVKPAAKGETALPDAVSGDAAREALLAFVRERSSELATCAAGRRERLRLTVRLEVARNGAVESVSVLEEDTSLAATRACVERGMRGWTLPAEWLSGERTLLVSVVL